MHNACTLVPGNEGERAFVESTADVRVDEVHTREVVLNYN